MTCGVQRSLLDQSVHAVGLRPPGGGRGQPRSYSSTQTRWNMCVSIGDGT